MSHPKPLPRLLKKVFLVKQLKRCIFFAVIPAFLFYTLSLIVLKASGFNIIQILRDPAQQTGESSFLGFVSNIGVCLLVSSATICFFAISTKNLIINSRHKDLLFLTGILSTLLAVDDFFLIHDRYVHEIICYLLYAGCAVTLLKRHYQMITKIDSTAFMLATSFFVLSILTDFTQHSLPLSYEYTQVLEEAFKFIGMATWLYFTCRIASYSSFPSETM